MIDDILDSIALMTAEDIPKPLKIKKGKNRGQSEESIKEKQICNMLSRIWRRAKIHFFREAKLLIAIANPEAKTRKGLNKYLCYGEYYFSITMADFVIHDVAIEVKTTNGLTDANNRQGFEQCKNYLYNPRIKTSLLLSFNRDRNQFYFWEVKDHRAKFVWEDARVIEKKKPEIKKHDQYERLRVLLDYSKRKTKESLEKMRKEYQEAGYL